MDFSMIQNVSAATLRSKGKTYSVSGAPVAEQASIPSFKGASSTGTGIFNTTSLRSGLVSSNTRAAVQTITSDIHKQQGLATYAKYMHAIRDNRFRTRYDLLI